MDIMKLRNAVVVDGVRSPFSWGGRGMFEATRIDEVAAQVLQALMKRNPKVKPTMIDDIGIGNNMCDADLAMLGGIPRLAGLLPESACFHTNRQCGSSMETMQRIAMGIMLGMYDCGIALGVERLGRSLMRPPPSVPPTRVTGMNPRVLEKTKEQRDLAYDHDKYFSVPIPDAILDGPPVQGMPQTAQNVVDMYGLTRKELDEYAVRSHKKLLAAYEAGIYKDEVIPMEVEKPVIVDRKWIPEEKGEMVVFDRDECLRPDCSMEGLAKLGPIKGLISYCGNEVIITAGNSCPTNSGASAILLMAEEQAIKLGLEPVARIVGMGVHGVKGQIMGMGPVPATFKAVQHAGIEMDQIDRVEFNEAFAAQVIPSLKELGISEDITNVNGGSLGIGHPLGATGARLVLTVAKETRRSGKRYGLATQCIGSGQGISTIVEAMN